MFLRLLILACLLFSKTTFAQNCMDAIFQNPLYSGSNNIINGRKWINEVKYSGSPLLMEKYWPIAEIKYNGVLYSGILMNYNVYKNELIIFQPEKGKEKFVVLNNNLLSGFTFIDTLTNRKHSYEYIELTGNPGKALYENATVGKSVFYIKPLKNIEIKSSSNRQGEFSSHFEYYLKVGKDYVRFNSKRQLLKLLASHITELKKFIRKNKLRINYMQPEHVITVLKYYNELK
jgi:hypothetical protein